MPGAPRASEPAARLAVRPAAADWVERAILPLDRLFNWLYTSRYNPLYQSGTLVVLCLAVLIVTGLYTLLIYRIGAPYESVEALEAQWWAGRWIRALHTYAADTVIVLVAIHLLRMLFQGRTWGPRALAWMTGVVLLGGLLLTGWTGMVLVWNRQSQLLATQGARLLDVLPIFSEPIQRNFVSTAGVAASFFFLNLLVHMLLPLWVAGMLWLHTLRLNRPRLLPPRRLALWMVAALFLLAVAFPVGLMPKASFSVIVGQVPLDLFYNAWLIPARHLPAWITLSAWSAAAAALLSVPWWWKPGTAQALVPAVNNEDVCTGCTQCYQDCPYEAIAMVPAPPGNTATRLVARVDPALCVSCGICAGSCAPMIIGPPGRTGRDLVNQAQRLAQGVAPAPTDVVVLACAQGLEERLRRAAPPGAHVLTQHCAGASHTSAIEFLLRRGFGGVYVLACPERDCFYRFGTRWMGERLFHDREAELQERVDKRRVRLAGFSKADWPAARADLSQFQEAVRQMAHLGAAEEQVDLLTECEPVELPRVGQRR